MKLKNLEVKIVAAVQGQPVREISSPWVATIQPSSVSLPVVRENDEAQVASLSEENNIHRRCPVKGPTGLESRMELLSQV